jgi:ribosomal protein L11 methyltransferase
MTRHRGNLWHLSIVTTKEAEDALSELVSGALGHPAASYADAETGISTVSAFLETKMVLREAQALVSAAASKLRANGLDVGDARVSLARVRKQDWAESWKRHFKPLVISRSLLIKPGWSRRKPRAGQRVVVIDPGLSFGTGQHPTTAFCLRELAVRRKSGKVQSFLDLGCGSGILAIAAAKLGYSPVHAYDIDPDAIRIARANARRNRVERRVSFQCRDITTLHEPFRSSSYSFSSSSSYHVICANLTSDLLLTQRDRILSLLQPHGVIVLAGILRTEFPKLRRAYEAVGLKLIASRARNEWQSSAFRPWKPISPNSPSPQGPRQRRPARNH